MDFKLKRFKKNIDVTRMANIHYFELTKEYQTFKDNHAFCELVYVDVGEINIEADNYTGPVKENCLIIHRAGETHSLICRGSTAPSIIIIGFECKAEELAVFSKKPILLNQYQQRLLSDVLKEGKTVFLPPYDIPYLKDMKKRDDSPYGADQMIKLKLETLLIELVRSYDLDRNGYELVHNEPKTYNVYGYISQNFKEKITLDELCMLFGTNKTTLCRSFKSVYNKTIMEYIIELRMKEARKLIREGNNNMTEIAQICVFSSIHYFSRAFKHEVGISPTEYIRTIKAKLDE